MSRVVLLLCLLLLTPACTRPAPPLLDVHDLVQPQEVQLRAMQQELDALRQQLAAFESRLGPLEPLTARMARLEALVLPQPPARKGKQRSGQDLKPAQLVALAQQEARMEPSRTGYWGRSAEQAYTWQPGRVYTVYLTAAHPTGIALPPGEHLVIGLALDKDQYDVITKRAGSDVWAYDTIAIRPLFDRGEADGWLLTQSGRRYLFHFVIGQIGMMALTFETPAITPEASHDPTLILPKPPQ